MRRLAETPAADDDEHRVLVVRDAGDDLGRYSVAEYRVHLDVEGIAIQGAGGGHCSRDIRMRSKVTSFEQPDGVHGDDPPPEVPGQPQCPLDRGKRLRRRVDTDHQACLVSHDRPP